MRLAYVIPWFGPDLKGGAEQHAWQFSTRLAARGHEVEALTTCCRSYLEEWTENHLAAGEETVGGVRVRRFPVDPRNRPRFDTLNAKLLALPRSELRPGVWPVEPAEASAWTDDNINSRALERYLAENAASYDALVFIPYLYGPTLRGVPLAGRNAWMQPCLHDEAYAYLPDAISAIHASRGLLFNSEGEQHLAARLYGPSIWSKGHVVGGGIEFAALDQKRESALPPMLDGRKFVLCLGRREPEKGVDFLVEAFRAARAHADAHDLVLALAGPGARQYDSPGEGIVDLGLVSDEVRVALLHGCVALAIPSPNESFSRVLFEAWYAHKPVLVRGCCDATRLPVENAAGGWVAETREEWVNRLREIARLAGTHEALAEMGSRGRAHAESIADWDRVMERFEAFVAPGGPGKPGSRTVHAVRGHSAEHPAAIHQLSPNLGYGDAISNEMLEVRAMLRAAGYRSEIFATNVDDRLAGEGVRYRRGVLSADDALIYHHSIGAEVTAVAIEHPGPKGLIYHNITPAEYFRPFRPEFARILRDGREDLWRLAPAFPVSVGDSAYNAAELRRYGFADPGVMPLPVDPITWDLPPAQDWMRRLSDGRRNILFVGRVAPNKRQDRLVRAFSILRGMVDARLVIAGSAPPGDPYADSVRESIAELGLDQDVVMTGHCSVEDLHACFRTSSLFWSFSEHEGFCVPLIEAMWFDIPVVALSSSAVPETLAEAGQRFHWLDDDGVVATRAARILVDEVERRRLLATQRRRRETFARGMAKTFLERFVDRILAAGALQPMPALAQ
jgi:glycosyltransferase involved in cell wall biosynthesis